MYLKITHQKIKFAQNMRNVIIFFVKSDNFESKFCCARNMWTQQKQNKKHCAFLLFTLHTWGSSFETRPIVALLRICVTAMSPFELELRATSQASPRRTPTRPWYYSDRLAVLRALRRSSTRSLGLSRRRRARQKSSTSTQPRRPTDLPPPGSIFYR